MIKLSFLVNDRELKTTFSYSNQMVKAFNSRTKSSLNNKLEQLNKILLRFLEKQTVEFSKQPVELVWQQSQNKVKFSKSFSKSTKCKTTGWIDISTGWIFTSFRKHIFFKRIKILLTLDHHKEWNNKFKYFYTLTHNQQQGLQAFPLDLETSKHLVQHK